VVLITPPNAEPFNKERKKEKQQKKERKKEKQQKQEKTKNDIVTPIKGFLYFF
tara:strand:- start:374 stop:532 length:159 start_codon:yes stop_codon:yes gene_type:complete